MITKNNQTTRYLNEVVKDAIRLIRIGESAIVYSSIDVKTLKCFFGIDNLMVIHLSPKEAFQKFNFDRDVWFVSYSEEILDVMAYAETKLYILKDMGINLSKKERNEFLHLISKSEVERKFWKYFDQYSEMFD